jgi:hypothetical protein
MKSEHISTERSFFPTSAKYGVFFSLSHLLFLDPLRWLRTIGKGFVLVWILIAHPLTIRTFGKPRETVLSKL